MISAKLQPLSRELELAVRNDLAPAARSRLIAQVARDDIAKIDRDNDAAVGTDVLFNTIVDGRKGAALESVNPDNGTIAAVWNLQSEVIDEVLALLRQHSPVKSGEYRDSHTLFADGNEVGLLGRPQLAKEWVFISTVPYARKIERGSSSMAADGVYESVAAIARGRFGNLATIAFTFSSLAAGGGSAIDKWAGSASGRAWARQRSHRRESLHGEWLRRQPAIFIRMK